MVTISVAKVPFLVQLRRTPRPHRAAVRAFERFVLVTLLHKVQVFVLVAAKHGAVPFFAWRTVELFAAWFEAAFVHAAFDFVSVDVPKFALFAAEHVSVFPCSALVFDYVVAVGVVAYFHRYGNMR